MSNTSIKEIFLNTDYTRVFDTKIEEDGIGTYEYWGATYVDSIVEWVVGTSTLIFENVNDSLEEVEDFLDEFRGELIDIAVGDGDLTLVNIIDVSSSYEHGVVNFIVEFYAS